MKKSELQIALDKRKYIESEKQGKDLSGFMDYCEYCNMRILKAQFFKSSEDVKECIGEIVCYGCSKSQELREKYNLCGKAYIKRDHERRRSK